MKLIVASLNPQKIAAVSQLISQYPLLAGSTVEGVNVNTGVGDQPKSLDETVRGAINRAKAAHRKGYISFGIESGLMEVPYTKTGMMDVCACAIYEGSEIHLGLSSAFEPPKLVAKFMKEGMNMSDASVAAGLTTNKNLGAAEGLIGIVTHGRMDRLAYTKQAVMTALVHLENAHLFKE